MKGRSSSKQGKINNKVGVSMEKDKVDKVKEEPHLSGAYIRSLVKHLTSTRPKDSFDGGIVNTNDEGDHHNMKQESPPSQQPQPPPPPPQIKKQVRRRQHTTRPYQERLLNMAEARREIVTALKFHRASMKQQEAATYTTPATTTSATASPPSVPHYWAIPTIAPPPLPPLYQENYNFALPSQTLGLNLNIQDFKNLDANLYHNPLSVYPTSSSSTSSSSSSSSSLSSSSSTSSSAAISGGEMAVGMPEEVAAGGLHHAMDEDEMEEIKSIGEQHEMEWNDTVNLVMSARWFKFLKTMEIEPEGTKLDTQKDDFYGFNQFDQIMEFPPWLINANEQQHFHDHFSDDYLQDSALSCMEIGEIEGTVDGEWLA